MPKPKTRPMEKRSLAPSEFRAEGDGKIVGYAAVFDTWADDGWGGQEMIKKGAFKKTLKESPDIRALWNHDTNIVLGRTTNGTLALEEDDHGLRIELELPDTQAGRDAKTSIERGDVSQMSFGFRVVKDSWDREEKKRELIEIELFEVSPVTFPFYPTTVVGVREAMIRAGVQEERIEQVIRAMRGQEIETEEPDSKEIHSDENTQEPGQVEEPHSREQHIPSVAMLRRRLQLLESEV